jgi:hypothetical protein
VKACFLNIEPVGASSNQSTRKGQYSGMNVLNFLYLRPFSPRCIIMEVTPCGLVPTHSYQRFGVNCNLHVQNYSKTSLPNYAASHHKKPLYYFASNHTQKMEKLSRVLSLFNSLHCLAILSSYFPLILGPLN